MKPKEQFQHLVNGRLFASIYDKCSISSRIAFDFYDAVKTDLPLNRLVKISLILF